MGQSAGLSNRTHQRRDYQRKRGGVGLPRVEVLETAAVDKKGDPSGS